MGGEGKGFGGRVDVGCMDVKVENCGIKINMM